LKETEIFFCGLSKNNINSLTKNIEFILEFKNNSKYKKINLLFVDSNSNDGSKDYLNKYSDEFEFFNVIHKDDLSLINSRIEKIKICRNLCLKFIENNYKNNSLVYIPLDTDFYLFSKTSPEKLDELIDYVLQMGNNAGIFPVSEPYYYDIFALRAKRWLNINSQLIVTNLKKYIRVGSFIFNYLFIFRYQLSPKHIELKKFTVTSAFGGIGIYNLSNFDLKDKTYDVSKKSKDLYSEHLFFNKYFDYLEIKTDWVIDAPKEHILFKSFNYKDKIIYIIKTFKEDFKSFLNYQSN
tara:strand:+ start:5401 stop:6285 length:885 start_codon:yes stop_codon:yes gene_type:complete